MPTPKADEVLVRVAAAAVTAGDARIRGARFPRGFGFPGRLAMGVRGPRVRTLGNSFSGVVEQVGRNATGFSIGDEVAGMTGARMGAHAELCLAPARSVAHKPDRVSFVDAAGLLFGGTTALHFLRDRARVAEGDSVLVIGASGAVGSSAVQLAHHAGARVTGTASTPNLDLVRDIGAAEAIDYTTTPISTLTGSFDVVLDTVGALHRADAPRLLAPGGRMILVAATLVDTITARGSVIAGAVPERGEDIAEILDLAAEGPLRPLVTHVAGLEALPDAHRLIDSGHKVGNLVITPGGVQQPS